MPGGVVKLSWEDFSGEVSELAREILQWNPNFLEEFYEWLRKKMSVSSNFGVDFPHCVFNRDVCESIKMLLLDDINEIFVDGFKPGNGFEWLKTGLYVREPGYVYGEYLTRDYLEDMFEDRFINDFYNPELRLNKTSEDLGVWYSVGLKSVGFVPSRIKGVVKINYPHEAICPSYNLDAKMFFSKYDWCRKIIGEYNWPRICLQNEMKSVSRFCGDNQLSSRVGLMDFGKVYDAFIYCCRDWGFEFESVALCNEEFVVKNRSWVNSPGYPYNKNLMKDARQAFDRYYGLIMHYYYSSMSDWMPTIFNVFCKKEILKKVKVVGNDVRTIIAPALCQQYMMQRLTLNLSDQVSRNWRTSHTSIGRTRWRGDVDFTGCRIGRFPVICEYDISKWDRSIKAFLLKLFWIYCWFVIDTREVGHFFQLANGFESVIYSFMLHKNGEVVRKMYGVPSGFTLTSYVNSWIHTFLNVFSFLDLCPEGIDDKLQYMVKNVDFVVYGDDGLMGMSNEVASWYTLERRSQWLRDRFGIVMEVANCKVSDHYWFKFDGVDVDGIVFLGDVMRKDEEIDQIVPVFKIIKIINQFVCGSGVRDYTPAEEILICFGHYVECYYHPNVEVIYEYLVYLLDKYKFAYLTKTSSVLEYVQFLGVSNNEMISKIKSKVLDIKEFRRFVFESFYASDGSDSTSI